MDLKKYQNIEKSISQERLSVYSADGADTDTVLARYFYNIEIRFLHNRIAHHERILHWQDLKLKHDTIIDFIGWMNPDLQKIAIDVDTFPDVYNAGLAPFLQKAENDWN